MDIQALITEVNGMVVRTNTLNDVMTALVVFVATVVILRILKNTIGHRLAELASAKEERVDDLILGLIGSVSYAAYVALGLCATIQFLDVPAAVVTGLYTLTTLILSIYVVLALQGVLDSALKRVVAKKEGAGEKVDSSFVDLTGKFQKVLLWGIAAVLILSNLGYDVTALVAALGVGGMALAFGLKEVISDIFSSISIYLDEPFEVGDFIEVGSDSGTVKHIGVKSTRIQTLPGTELIVPNRTITGTKVNNYKVREKRRVVFGFGVTYDTPTKQLKWVADVVKEIIEGLEHAEFGRIHFKSFGDYSLDFEVVYLVDTTDYAIYMDLNQEILLTIKERLEKEGVEFAYPTQTHYVVNATK